MATLPAHHLTIKLRLLPSLAMGRIYGDMGLDVNYN